MEQVIISHASGIVNGTVQLPASKSIANRLLLMRAVAGFDHLAIENLSNANDTVVLNEILKGLDPSKTVDVHDAGTVMRFLTAYLSCIHGEWKVTGTDRMQQRPIGALVEVLRKLGADITYEKKEGYPPLLIRGKKLSGGSIEIDGSVSSQFLSALLMVTPLFEKPLELHIKNTLVSVPYVEMTLQLMREWGAEVIWTGNVIQVQNKPYTPPAGTVFVENDWSAASYFYSILAMAKEGELRLPHLFGKSLQGDSVCAEIFTQLGIESTFTEDGLVLKKKNTEKKHFEFDFIKCPDIAQTLAVCCAAKGVGTHLNGLQTLTVKETDRITALKNEFSAFGLAINTTPDSISFSGGTLTLPVATVRTYKDHRMAMSFAPLALVLPGLKIEDPAVVRKSFPDFWKELKKLGFQVNEA